MTEAEDTYMTAIKAANEAVYYVLQVAKDARALPHVDRKKWMEIARATDDLVDEGIGR